MGLDPAKTHMAYRRIWKSFVETLAAEFVPFGVVTRPRTYRSASWWPV